MTNLAVFGTGIMGEYSIRELAPKCDKVYISSGKEKKELEKMFQGDKFVFADSPAQAVENADFVLFCVPTDKIEEYMAEVLPYCRQGAIISGQTSRKTPEAEAFDRHMAECPNSGLELVTIHTMCNPGKSDASKEILGIINHKAGGRAYEKALEFYGGMSEHIEEFESAEEHDICVANTQINTSKTFLSIASAFAKVGCFPGIRESYTTAFDEMKFSLAMRVASQEAHVYRGIQFGSRHGKAIVAPSIAVENDLYRMVVGDKRRDYEDRVRNAKKIIFGDGALAPILKDEDMLMFGNLKSAHPNSHFSIINYAVAFAESGKNPFADLKATTPMYTSLLCLMDRLFIAEGALERALSAPFLYPEIRTDDLDFHNEINGWSDALVFDNIEGYNSRHEKMRAVLDSPAVEFQFQSAAERSKEVVRVCREAMARAIESGRVKVA
ncbi:prephenate dehydrogenase [Candidatus Woesearchaeota archaeon]|nr:prephenate dehydrogenase [Candidatus Woesearchaeota archaeon]